MKEYLPKIKVKFAGIDVSKPYNGALSIIYIPDQRQVLMPGQKYELVIEGLSFTEKDTGKSGK